MDYSVKDFYIPTVTYFESDNFLTGSRNGMNYKMLPMMEEKQIALKVWYGEMNLAHSELVAEQIFSMTQESMKEIENWLYQQYDIYLETPQAAAYLKKKKSRYS